MYETETIINKLNEIKTKTDEIMEMKNNFQSILNKIDGKFDQISMNVTNKIHSSNKINNVSSLIWNIDDFSSIGNSVGYIDSKFFHTKNHEFEMQLWMHPNGFGNFIGSHLSFQFGFWDGSRNVKLIKPFKGDIIISISDASDRNRIQIIQKYCQFNEPITCPYLSSEAFHFSYSDETKVLKSNSIIIKCVVILD